MARKKYFLGVDAGSVSMGIALLDEGLKIRYTSYSFHNGQIAENLRKSLQGINLKQVRGLGYTLSEIQKIKDPCSQHAVD